jgi:hypothetical protein
LRLRELSVQRLCAGLRTREGDYQWVLEWVGECARFRTAALIVVSILWLRPALAQETVNYGSLSGRVVDPQGAVVPGARVSARQTDTNIVGESITDEGGGFVFRYLRVGPA